MKTTFTLLFWILLLFSASHLFSQETISIPTVLKPEETGWKTVFNNGNAEISYQNITCSPGDGLNFHYLLFRVSNLSDGKIEVSWEFNLFINEQELMISPDEKIISLSLEPGTWVEAGCNLTEEDPLRILVSELTEPARIHLAQLQNLIISPIKK